MGIVSALVPIVQCSRIIIQSLINVTCLGNRESQSYNEGVFKNNLKHAILGQIRAPPEGFSLVTRSHFFHKRESLIKVSKRRPS